MLSDDDEKVRIHQMLRYEKELWEKGIHYVAGIDEAGRGPLAGPVVAAAVIFPPDVFISGINDSKKLSSKKREALYPIIQDRAIVFSTGLVNEKEIDRINILQASYRAMRMAIGKLPIRPQHLLIDGRPLPEKFYPQTAIEGGDRKSFSIAAASIVAKVTRDRLMIAYDKKYPNYGFAQHKGYGTQAHVEAIRQHGLCDIHRKTFHIKAWKSV
ncbi:ribonuclease HII [bacterium]|nr:ribonuclease HII [bacterium]